MQTNQQTRKKNKPGAEKLKKCIFFSLFEIKSHAIAQTDWKPTMWPKLPLNSKTFCLNLLSAG